MELKSLLRAKLKTLSESSPLLVSGDEANEALFAVANVRYISVLSSIDEVRDFVEQKSGGTRLVVADVTSISETGEGVLLKFVEEYRGNLILIDRADKLGDTMISRMRTVIGGSSKQTTTEWGSYQNYIGVLDSSKERRTAKGKLELMVAKSPKAYKIEQEIRPDMLRLLRDVL